MQINLSACGVLQRKCGSLKYTGSTSVKLFQTAQLQCYQQGFIFKNAEDSFLNADFTFPYGNSRALLL